MIRRLICAISVALLLASPAGAAVGSQRAVEPSAVTPSGWVVALTGAGYVYAVRPDWSGRRVVGDARGDYPALSPNGRWIAAVRSGELWRQPLRGGDANSRRIATGAWPGSVAWTPDGTHVLFTGRGGLWIVGADGRAKRRLISTPQQISSVAMSPDSTRIAFTVAGQLWVARSNGSGSRRMINGRGELPQWAPGGRRVTLIDEFGISAVDVRTGRRERIFVLPYRYDDQGVADYVWSPDGRFLAVSSWAQYECAEDPTGPCSSQAFWIVRVTGGVGTLVFEPTSFDETVRLAWRASLP